MRSTLQQIAARVQTSAMLNEARRVNVKTPFAPYRAHLAIKVSWTQNIEEHPRGPRFWESTKNATGWGSGCFWLPKSRASNMDAKGTKAYRLGFVHKIPPGHEKFLHMRLLSVRDLLDGWPNARGRPLQHRESYFQISPILLRMNARVPARKVASTLSNR